ncbi:E3 ubiquitin-protein ligase MARCHF2 isoform X3 [Dermochelys coriacea]|uniref:E3 ubiquitin-protein ligase MARCHF2 isoform X3 n=1 Tax=Dermochelys coriacea TaxID=27794 RepID=UPI0018E70534|nr:E3 ubiquitin-protein ligase MARCHF2 isoform X3 [Dermochelys coriacea]
MGLGAAGTNFSLLSGSRPGSLHRNEGFMKRKGTPADEVDLQMKSVDKFSWSDGPICRICHEGGNGEGLLSPCDCTGTLGTVHKSCLEKWLSSSNTSYCELCHTEFVVERRPRPLTEWLKDPGPRNEKRTLFCDMVCFLFITPLAAISGWLCLRGAQDHLQFNSRLEAIGLIALTIALFTIYVLWTLVSFRYHCQLYSEWRRTNQKVRLMIPDSKSPHPVQHSLLSTKLMKKNADETTV